jgi:hypothetical protein
MPSATGSEPSRSSSRSGSHCKIPALWVGALAPAFNRPHHRVVTLNSRHLAGAVRKHPLHGGDIQAFFSVVAFVAFVACSAPAFSVLFFAEPPSLGALDASLGFDSAPDLFPP